MSTQPPTAHHHREELMRVSQANMAVAQPTKTKSASKATNNAASKQKAQMHRRSRTGLCFPLLCPIFYHSLY
jgi:C6 transcription factor Pro1